jgi:hypothetical protein
VPIIKNAIINENKYWIQKKSFTNLPLSPSILAYSSHLVIEKKYSVVGNDGKEKHDLTNQLCTLNFEHKKSLLRSPVPTKSAPYLLNFHRN